MSSLVNAGWCFLFINHNQFHMLDLLDYGFYELLYFIAGRYQKQ